MEHSAVGHGKLTTKTLAVTDRAGRRPAAATFQLVGKVIERHELTAQQGQVLAIRTDNAKATLKTMELLNLAEEQESDWQESSATPEGAAADDLYIDVDCRHLVKNIPTLHLPPSTLCGVRRICYTGYPQRFGTVKGLAQLRIVQCEGLVGPSAVQA